MRLVLGNERRTRWLFHLVRHLRCALVVLLACMTTGFGQHPMSLFSPKDIKSTPSDIEQIAIPFLPLEHYPLLSKFKQVKTVSFYSTDGTGASDEKLEALAKNENQHLKDITLLNCPLVTDGGIRHISTITALRMLQLEGTSITDEALEIISSKMRLTGLNISNCPKVTMKGLLKLATSETLKEFGFSANDLSQEDVVRLINEFRTITWCGIVDPSEKLDAQVLKILGKEKGVRVVIKRTGALQDVKKARGGR